MNNLSLGPTDYLITAYRFEIAAYMLQIVATLCSYFAPPHWGYPFEPLTQPILATQESTPTAQEAEALGLKRENLDQVCSQLEAAGVTRLPTGDDRSSFHHCQQISLLQTVLESFIDGILIVNDLGEWIHANEFARQVCHQMNRGKPQRDYVPKEIWRVCRSLIKESDSYPEDEVTVEAELTIGKTAQYRIRSRWLTLEQVERPCLLVTITDQLQSLRNLALVEAKRWGLTPSEKNVWLLFRTGYQYKDIAHERYISENTVRKHMKNIRLKRNTVIGQEA